MELVPRAEGAIGLREVRRAFDGRRIVEGQSISADPGSCVGIIGPNGSGKTTMLRLVAGTLGADEGSIEVCGAPPGRGASAFVPAGDRGLYWRLSVGENLAFFARVAGTAGWRERARDAAELLGLEELAGRRVESCSTGQRRRVMIARALASCAPVLIVDEPFEGLDEGAIGIVEGALTRWTDAGGLVLWAAPTATGGPAPDRLIDLGTEAGNGDREAKAGGSA